MLQTASPQRQNELLLTIFLLPQLFLLALPPGLGFALICAWQVLEGALWVRATAPPSTSLFSGES